MNSRDTDAAVSLWTEASTPNDAGQLAVHTKKVEEVRAWLEQFAPSRVDGAQVGDGPTIPHFHSDHRGRSGRNSIKPATARNPRVKDRPDFKGPRGRIKSSRTSTCHFSGDSKVLVLKGPPGCGKSTVVRVLAKLLDFSVLEWSTPVPTLWAEHKRLQDCGRLSNPGESRSLSGPGYLSKLDSFLSFLRSSTKFAPLQLNQGKEHTMGVQQHLPRANSPSDVQALETEQTSSTILEAGPVEVKLVSDQRETELGEPGLGKGTKKLQGTSDERHGDAVLSQRVGTNGLKGIKSSKRPQPADGTWGNLAFLSQGAGSEPRGGAGSLKADAVSELEALRHTAGQTREDAVDNSEGSEELPGSSQIQSTLRDSRRDRGRGMGRERQSAHALAYKRPPDKSYHHRGHKKKVMVDLGDDVEAHLVAKGDPKPHQAELDADAVEDDPAFELSEMTILSSSRSARDSSSVATRLRVARAGLDEQPSDLHQSQTRTSGNFDSSASQLLRKSTVTGGSEASQVACVKPGLPLLLLDDFPFVASRSALMQLCSALHILAQKSAVPAIVILSEATSGAGGGASDSSSHAWDETVKRAQLAALQDGGAHVICFNPVTPRMILKNLTAIATSQRGSQWASMSSHAASLAAISQQSAGDLRRAICQLQLLLAGSSGSTTPEKFTKARGQELWQWDPGGRIEEHAPGKKKKRGGMRKAKVAVVQSEKMEGAVMVQAEVPGLQFHRDHSLTLFHALGKILHNRRKQTQPACDNGRTLVEAGAPADEQGGPSNSGSAGSLAQQYQRAEPDMQPVEDILSQAQLEAPTLGSFLHENYLDFFDNEMGLDDAAAAAAYFSDSQLLLAGPRVAGRFFASLQSWATGEDEACTAGPGMAAAAAASVAARGLLFSNCHPAPSRFHLIRPPAVAAADKRRRETQIDYLQRLQHHSAQVGCFSIPMSSFVMELYPNHHQQQGSQQGWQLQQYQSKHSTIDPSRSGSLEETTEVKDCGSSDDEIDDDP